ncbi:MAG: hypothetical protein ABIK65_13140 [Candidatus Eisenbacteria bacterium]
MKRLAVAGALAALVVSGAAFAAGGGDAEVVFADRSVRSGRVLSLDATDLVLQENPRATPRLIPLAEIRRIRFDGGPSLAFAPVEDPAAGEGGAGGSSIRSTPWVGRDDLVLSRGEAAWNSVPRGIVIGTVAMLFADGAEQKALVFAAAFSLQFGVSLAMGW